jgi:hypothetical protein
VYSRAIDLIPVLAILCAGILNLIKISSRFGALETKVNTMWEFQMRRAVSEAIANKVGTQNSPLTITTKAQAFLDPIKDELRTYWKFYGHKLTEFDAMLQLEQMFGDRLLNLICLPCGLSHGACLVVALSVAKGTQTLELFDGEISVTYSPTPASCEIGDSGRAFSPGVA